MPLLTRRIKKNRRNRQDNADPPGGDTMERRIGPTKFKLHQKVPGRIYIAEMTTRREEDSIKNPFKRALHKAKSWVSFNLKKTAK